jgi:hypothetical protein
MPGAVIDFLDSDTTVAVEITRRGQVVPFRDVAKAIVSGILDK